MRERVTVSSLVALSLLTISTLVLVNIVAKPQPIKIILGEGEPLVLREPLVWTLTDLLLVVASSLVAGASALYMFRAPSATERLTRAGKLGALPLRQRPIVQAILRSLPRDHHRVMSLLLENGGQILQRDLVLRAGLSPAKVSRVLKLMEEKKLVKRRPQGNTRRISLPEWIIEETTP